MPRDLTIIVPAYNEEARIGQVIATVATLAREELDAFEIVVVDDGSSDGTGDVAAAAREEFPEIRILRHPANRGVGAAYAAALATARMSNLTLVPGDNAFGPEGLRRLFQAVGSADLIVSYRANPWARSLPRRALSVACNRLLRLASRCPLRDGHSLFVWPTDWARDVEVPPDYRYHMVSLLRLLRRARTYWEVPVDLTARPDRHSRVMRFDVVWKLGTMMALEVWRSIFAPPQQRPHRLGAAQAPTPGALHKAH